MTEPHPAAGTVATALLVLAAVLILGAGRVPVVARLGIGARAWWLPAWTRVLFWRFGGALPRVATIAGAAVTGLACGGVVAALYAVVYLVLFFRALDRADRMQRERRTSAAVDDLVTGLAADVRAGLPASAALELGVEALASAEYQRPGDRVPSSGGAAPAPVPTHRTVARAGHGAVLVSACGRGERRTRTHRGGYGPGQRREPVRSDPNAGTRLARPAPGSPPEIPTVGSALAPAAAAARTGGDVPEALRRVRLPGTADGLTRLAAAWQVSDSSGAPLADVLERVDADLGARRRHRARIIAELATATVTVRLLAMLPLLGLGLGHALGADPVHVLLHTRIGAVCALTALALQVVGLLWADRITTAPARRAPPCPAER